jgi:telomere length regulation protein
MFLSAITAHLSTLKESVRLEGMLVAEEISKASLDPKGPVKPLEFGDIWEGEGPAYDTIRKLKEWLSTSVDDWAVKDWEVEDDTEGEVEEPLDARPSFTSSRVKTNNQVPGDSSASGAVPPKKGLIQVIDSSVYDDYDDIEEPDLESYSIPSLPPAEDLEDIEDISAYTPSRKKPKPPIYIHDLCACLKSEDADKLDIGLREAESLIKRKANWGTELSE